MNLSIRSFLAVTCLLGAVFGCASQQFAGEKLDPIDRVKACLGLACVPCIIRSENSGITPAQVVHTDPTYAEPNGHPVPLTRAECEQKNQEALYERQRVAQQAQIEQRRRDDTVARAVRDEAARGYKRTTVRDLLLDKKVYAASETKVSVTGFYHAEGPRNERLYDSYNEFMMHTLNPSAFGYAEALNVGLISEDGSRTLREYLLRCGAGCEVTILGHVGVCTETNAFGRAANEFCLVAEDIRP
jgi:hypothetical protein